MPSYLFMIPLILATPIILCYVFRVWPPSTFFWVGYLILFAAMLIVLSGCVRYSHPTATVAQQQRDVVECRALAEQGAGPAGTVFRETRKGQLLSACYQSRGWLKE